MVMSFSVRRATRVALWAGLMLAFLAVQLPAWSDDAGYRLYPGDKIELKVVGLPELGQKAQVTVDGEVSLPLLGSIKVRGMTIAQVQEKVRATLPAKVFYRRSQEGKKVPYVADAEEITVEIAEYRPIYVSGDVPRPGEQAFRPSMRVRQALAQAGGYDIIRSRLGADILNVFDFSGNRDVLWLEFAREQARYWRISAELNEKPELPFEELVKRLPSVNGVATVARFEAEQLAVRIADWQKEQDFQKDAIARAAKRATVLAEQYAYETEGSTADLDELNRMKGLLDRGVTSQNRVTDARRAMLTSATRALQTGVQFALAERERDDRMRAFEKAADQRRFDLIRDQEESSLRLSSLRARIEINNRKLEYLGAASTQVAGGKAGKMEFVVIREDGEGLQHIKATEETLLMPGDVIEVTFKQELDFGPRVDPK